MKSREEKANHLSLSLSLSFLLLFIFHSAHSAPHGKGLTLFYPLIENHLVSQRAEYRASPPQKRDEARRVYPYHKISQKLRNRLILDSGQGKTFNVWVYFTDKGVFSTSSLKRKLAEARESLDERCLWRRSKVRSQRDLVDTRDLPLCSSYLKMVSPVVKRIRATSRWLNALSAEVEASKIQNLARLPFVVKLDLVGSFHRDDSVLSYSPDSSQEEEKNPFTDYGFSHAQLDQINVLPLHQLGYSGRDVLVCMLDTGFRKSHKVFQNSRLIAEWDFVNNDGDVEQNLYDPDDYSDSHGTGTWSILGGYDPGELIGPAFGSDFLLAKTETTNFEQPIEEDYWVAGIEWAESLGAEVVSSSLGYTDWYIFEDMDGETAVTTIAANRAVELGVVVVTAAGNERDKPWGHIIAPADGFDLISAGAVNSSGWIAAFSSPGPTYDGRIKPEVCALGVDNWLAANRSDGSGYYTTGSGTSFATPLVAGAAALLLEIHRDWTPAQVRSALLNTASRSSSPDNDYGWGIINVARAADLDLALLSLQSFTIDDDASGESLGNGNGKAEPGETIEVRISLKNEGRVTASSLVGSLRATHPEIAIVNPTLTFPPIPPLAVQTPEQAFVFRIPAFFPSHQAVFRLKVEGPNSLSLFESLRIPVSR